MTAPDGKGWDRLRSAVLAAADQAADFVARPEVAAAWDQPSALPEMTVGGLAAHLSQMLSAAVGWLGADPADGKSLAAYSLGEIYGLARMDADEGLDGEVARKIRGWAADGSDVGPGPVLERIRADLVELRALLPAVAPDRLVPSLNRPGAAMRADDYLRTRCVEFLVHVDDLAISVGLPTTEPDSDAAEAAVSALVELCRHQAGDLAVLRALSRPERADPEALRAL